MHSFLHHLLSYRLMPCDRVAPRKPGHNNTPVRRLDSDRVSQKKSLTAPGVLVSGTSVHELSMYLKKQSEVGLEE
jgi:hypothetical protein